MSALKPLSVAIRVSFQMVELLGITKGRQGHRLISFLKEVLCHCNQVRILSCISRGRNALSLNLVT